MATSSHLEITGSVQQQVAGLEVAVQHVGRVDVLEPTQYLVEEVAYVVVAEALGLQQLVQVSLHQGLDDVAGSRSGRKLWHCEWLLTTTVTETLWAYIHAQQ